MYSFDLENRFTGPFSSGSFYGNFLSLRLLSKERNVSLITKGLNGGAVDTFECFPELGRITRLFVVIRENRNYYSVKNKLRRKMFFVFFNFSFLNFFFFNKSLQWFFFFVNKFKRRDSFLRIENLRFFFFRVLFRSVDFVLSYLNFFFLAFFYGIFLKKILGKEKDFKFQKDSFYFYTRKKNSVGFFKRLVVFKSGISGDVSSRYKKFLVFGSTKFKKLFSKSNIMRNYDGLLKKDKKEGQKNSYARYEKIFGDEGIVNLIFSRERCSEKINSFWFKLFFRVCNKKNFFEKIKRQQVSFLKFFWLVYYGRKCSKVGIIKELKKFGYASRKRLNENARFFSRKFSGCKFFFLRRPRERTMFFYRQIPYGVFPLFGKKTKILNFFFSKLGNSNTISLYRFKFDLLMNNYNNKFINKFNSFLERNFELYSFQEEKFLKFLETHNYRMFLDYYF